MSHIWMSHVTHMQESCNICEWDVPCICMTHTYVWHDYMHDSFIRVTWLHAWLIHSCDMTLRGIKKVMSHMSMTIDMCDITFHVTHMQESCHTYDMTLRGMKKVMSHIWTHKWNEWSIHMCEYIIYVTWINHSCVTRKLFKCVNTSFMSHE